jgi:hypothetical protein
MQRWHARAPQRMEDVRNGMDDFPGAVQMGSRDVPSPQSDFPQSLPSQLGIG